MHSGCTQRADTEGLTLAQIPTPTCGFMWRRHGGLADLCCDVLTSGVGAFGTAGLFSRSFQRAFAGVRVIRLHLGLLLQAVKVRVCVYPVVVHSCCSTTISTTGHHHVSTEKMFPLQPPLSFPDTDRTRSALTTTSPRLDRGPGAVHRVSMGVQMLNNNGIRVSSLRRAAAPSQS
ncbi:hypothetical protein CHARACLAT_024462 [Characodon lateralis]|uniref:Uncharacterized protein n=1 Tax=Characodon lateralis TaxID=208331 RepID=A0ABU7E3W0_9TELE|nr:hypothetical protein [Characodon lateralis]